MTSAVDARIVHPDPASEFFTPERCFIVEAWNDDADPSVSIARSRVAPGVTTQLHSLDVDERYLVVAGWARLRWASCRRRRSARAAS
jgi:hypothetical protein